MSWLSSVVGNAEDFLNKLDKSAGDVLNEEANSSSAAKTQSNPGGTNLEQTNEKRLSPSQSVPSKLNTFNKDGSSSYVSSIKSTSKKTPKPPALSQSGSSQVAAKSGKAKKEDDELFDFLNNKDTSDSSKKRRTPASSRHHSRQSSTSSIDPSKNAKTDGSGSVFLTMDSTMDSSARKPSFGSLDEFPASKRDSPTTSQMSADMDILADAMKESPAASDQSNPESDPPEAPGERRERQLSSLELENRLLRNEVASLNEEMASVIQRAKEAETDLSRCKDKLRSQSNSAAMHDHLVRELQNRESDLTEALGAKDSQLAVLRVRLDEADRQATQKEASLEEYRHERDRILRDHGDSSSVHSQALDSMKEKLEEMEGALRREQQAYTQAQQEAGDRQMRHEQEQRSMAESLKALEKRQSEERAKISELNLNLKGAKTSADSARRELADYKDKAARILQSKEKLISSLREGSGQVVGDSGVSSLEHDDMRQERDMVREELAQLKLTVDNLRQELNDVESQLQQESDTSQDTIRDLEDALRGETQRREDAEGELLSQKQEQQYSIEEMRRQKTTFASRISDREGEIERLRNQLMTKSMSSSTEGELENRVRTLTESLIQKQTVLEALSTEKNSLVLQLERTEQQLRDMESAMPRHSPQIIQVNDHDDEVRQRLPLFLREGPTDPEFTRRMKRYANSIDGFSIRLGVFLRRYPVARLFIIVYMALLHLWVTMVMMTYQPEIHGHDFHPRPPGEEKLISPNEPRM